MTSIRLVTSPAFGSKDKLKAIEEGKAQQAQSQNVQTAQPILDKVFIDEQGIQLTGREILNMVPKSDFTQEDWVKEVSKDSSVQKKLLTALAALKRVDTLEEVHWPEEDRTRVIGHDALNYYAPIKQVVTILRVTDFGKSLQR